MNTMTTGTTLSPAISTYTYSHMPLRSQGGPPMESESPGKLHAPGETAGPEVGTYRDITEAPGVMKRLAPCYPAAGHGKPAPAIYPGEYHVGVKDYSAMAGRAALSSAFMGGAGCLMSLIPFYNIVVGATAGGAAGLMISSRLCTILGMDYQKKEKMQAAAILAGLVAGGVATAMVPFSVIPAVSGVIGFGMSLETSLFNKDCDKEKAIDARALSGKYRTSPLFREALKEKGIEGGPLEEQARAAERLEQAGWKLAATLDVYREHASYGRYAVEVLAPGDKDPARRNVAFTELPLLAQYACGEKPEDAPMSGFMEEIRLWDERGLPLVPYGDATQPVEKTPAGRLMQSLEVSRFLEKGYQVCCVHEYFGEKGQVALPGGSPLHAFMNRVAAVIEKADESPDFRHLLAACGAQERRLMLERLGALPDQEVARHASMMKELAGSASAQKEYTGILSDYDTLLAVRDTGMPLEASLAEYTSLLSDMAHMKEAAEAAPTYTFIRQCSSQGIFGSSSFDEVRGRFLSALLTADTVEEARQSLLRGPADGTGSLLEEHDGFFIVDGIKLPVKQE